MKENMKAALLSALVLPGVGQFYRGRKVKGAILVPVPSCCLSPSSWLRWPSRTCSWGPGSGGMDPCRCCRLSNGFRPLWLLGAFLCLWVYGVADALLGGGRKKKTPRK